MQKSTTNTLVFTRNGCTIYYYHRVLVYHYPEIHTSTNERLYNKYMQVYFIHQSFSMRPTIRSLLVGVVTVVAVNSNYVALARISYLTTATPAWTGTASPVGYGNGVYISPDGALAVVISRDASVKAFDSFDGTVVWTTEAPTTAAQSFGGASFCYGASQYILYSYVDANARYGYL